MLFDFGHRVHIEVKAHFFVNLIKKFHKRKHTLKL